MSEKIYLAELDHIIHHLENRQRSTVMCLNAKNGSLEVLQPELLGKQLFLLPDWSSEQGYELMLQFAHCEFDEELLRILHSRRQVFKRFRNYLQGDLKQLWLNFKRAHFEEYLRAWFGEQFDLQIEFEASVPHLSYGSDEELDIEDNLLAEDFVLVGKLCEGREQYVNQPWQVRVLRGLNPLVQEHGAQLAALLESLNWVNVLELHDPVGECVAQLFWCWTESGAQLLQVLSQYEKSYRLEKYLLENFLETTCPKLAIEQVDIFFATPEDWLEGFVSEAEVLGKYARIFCH